MATASSLGGGGVQNAYDSVAAGQTDSVLIAAIPNRRIRVLTYMINQGDTTPSAVTFNSKPAGSGTAIWPAIKYPANGGAQPPMNERGWFSTNRGEGLTVTTGAGSTTGIAVVYDTVS
jgi:hypothetical protein